MNSLCFVVPAWKRVELSAVCFRQWRVALDRLGEYGIDAQVVVIADDENLDLAVAEGFATLHRKNMLGAKLNAGYRYAADNGFQYVAALGSDSFFCPERIGPFELPEHGEMLCTRNYTVVSPDGRAQARLKIPYDGGIGTRVFRTEMLAQCKYEPVEPGRMKSCDVTTLNTLRRDHAIRFLYTDEHQFEILGFFTKDVQITAYDELLRLWLAEPLTDPLSDLDQHYPSELLERAHALYVR